MSRISVSSLIAACVLLAACSQEPGLSPTEARKAVTAALGTCDVARDKLDIALVTAGDTQVYRAALEVESECQAATLAMMRLDLSDAVQESCQNASEGARIFASLAKDLSDNPKASNASLVEDASSMARAQRNQCEAVLTA